MLCFVSLALAASPALVLPPDADEADWRTAAALTGFSLADAVTDEVPVIRLVTTAETWTIVAVHDTGERRMDVAPPASEQEREDVLWLAATLVDAVPIPTPAPLPVVVARPPSPTPAATPRPAPPTPPPPPAPEPVALARVEAPIAPTPSSAPAATPAAAPAAIPEPPPILAPPTAERLARRSRVGLALSTGLGFTQVDAGELPTTGHLGLDALLGRGLSVGAGFRVQRWDDVPSTVDVAIGGAWSSPRPWSPYVGLELGSATRWVRLPDGSLHRAGAPMAEVDLGSSVRLSRRLELRPFALLQVDFGGSSPDVAARTRVSGTGLPPPPPPPLAPSDGRSWRWGGAMVLAWRFL